MLAFKMTAQEFARNCEILGFTVDEAMPSVISKDGNIWTVDVVSGFFPRLPKTNHVNGTAIAMPTPPSGPGTELSNLLKRFGIEPTPTCACRAKAEQMDAWGPDECSKPERIEEVVGVMREEAKARGLPFLDMAARLLVKRAISNARKAEAKRAREAEGSSLHAER